jgi:large subunit ribosomal protein L5
MARLLELYRKEIVPKLAERLGRQNPLSLPKLQKIVVSMGVGRAATQQEKGRLDEAIQHLTQVTGQRPVIAQAKQSIAGFRVRKGMKVGCKVTLRGRRMYEFLDRLITIALPRVRDFRGINPKSFDGHGNFNLGITEESIFPEIDLDKMQFTQGLNVTIVIDNADDGGAFELLRAFGMPFRT